ncbi:MAG: UDP-3-O-(3-hydroxymyristoyl)glucosamine N-acyltransferase [Rickettsiaceae bacterium]|nr:MAG: UDP-3-O-(3-hydroxymyristoyl)glucosamine N-acyltransferase [Rickettsiaceae bacterium]
MTDNDFHNRSAPIKLIDIAQAIECEVDNQLGDVMISGIKSIQEAGIGDLTFFSNKKYLADLKKTKATSAIVDLDFVQDADCKTIFLRTSNPYLAYAKAINLFYDSAKKYSSKIMPSAYVSKSAIIGNNCHIGHNVVVEDKAEIGDDCIIESGTIIDTGVIIGPNAKIYSNVSISCSIIGRNVVILPGARIGQDGFGFATSAGTYHKIYHSGRVIIGDDVEIGANSTIDRGSLGDTIIGNSCRIDNLVQIAHNVKVGQGTIIVAQVGIAGSSEIGQYCAIGGQAGIAGHVKIADKVQITAQSGIMKNVAQENITLGGSPAVPVREWHRQSIILKKLTKDK